MGVVRKRSKRLIKMKGQRDFIPRKGWKHGATVAGQRVNGSGMGFPFHVRRYVLGGGAGKELSRAVWSAGN